MKKAIFLLFASTCFMYSQQKKIVYVDEYYKAIDYHDFMNKANSELFDFLITELDTVIYKKLSYKNYFGTIDRVKKSQLSKLIHVRYNIDTTKVWIIHYRDSIPNQNNMPEESGVGFLDSIGNRTGQFVTNKEFRSNIKKYVNKKHMHLFNIEDYIKSMKKEIQKTPKDVVLLHFYNDNRGFSETLLASNRYFKDPSNLIKKVFSDGMMMYSSIILFPNGDFYVSRKFDFQFEKKLTKRDYFDKKKKKWKKQYLKLEKRILKVSPLYFSNH